MTKRRTGDGKTARGSGTAILLGVAVLMMGFMLRPPTGAAADPEAVRIGAIYSLTGPGAVIGEGQKKGAELAVREINAAGGIEIGGRKRPVELLFRDDETRSVTAIRHFDDLVKNQGVTALVGGTFGHVSMAIKSAARRTPAFYIATNGVPERFFAQEAGAVPALCNVAAAEWAGRGAAVYMVEKMKAERITCFMPNYAIGRGTMEGFEEIMKSHPEVTYQVVWHPVKTPDMATYLKEADRSGAEVLFVGSWGEDAIGVLQQAHAMGIKDRMRIFHFWLMNVFATAVAPEAMAGVWGQMFWYHDMAGFDAPEVVAASQAFSKSYGEAYGTPPGPYAMTAHDGVAEIARAMRLAGSTGPGEMAAALMAEPEWSGAKGPARWRKDGVCLYKYATWIVEGKGPGERKGGRYPEAYDYARPIDAYSGDAFVPSPEALGSR